MIQKWKPYQKRALSFMLTIAMLFSTSITAFASESNPKVQPDMGNTQLNGQQATNMAETVSPSAAVQNEQRNIELGTEEQKQPEQASQPQAARIAARATYPSYQEAYNTMIGLKSKYPEGTTWTNFEPYGTGEGATEPYYTFKGGAVKGARLGVGCAAFVFILSDAVFGDIPATTYDNFTYEDIHVGDILRVNHNSHFVIVLQKSSAGIVVAEANYNKTVHWGRVMSVAEVMAADFVVSRYPKGHVDESVSNGDEVVNSGVADANLSWSLTRSGVLTISGSGVMQNYNPTTRPSWESESSAQITSIHIESGITSIGDYAFYQTSALDVYIPETVTHIGAYAFNKAATIVGITIPGSVTSIGNDAFNGCTSLTSVSISEGLTTIGERAFYGCTALQYIDFPASITNVGSGTFAWCTNLQSVRFAPGTAGVSIGVNPFTKCERLTSVTLPEKIDRISNGMFSGCITLKYLCIPASVECIYEVGAIEGSPFLGTNISCIDFCGSEDDWNSKGGDKAITFVNGGGSNVTVNFNTPFNNPFAPIDGDPGDLIDPTAHKHIWATGYEHDAAYHWHECNTPGCTVTDNSKKGSYGEHVYSEWIVDTAATAYSAGSKHRDCTVCGYSQTESIPATGASWWNPGGSSQGGSWNYGGSNGTGITGNNTNSTDNTNNGSDDTSNSTDDTNNSSGDTSNNQNNTDKGSGGTISPDSDTKTEDTTTPANPAKAKKQMKTTLKSEMKVSLKKQLNTQLKAKLKKQFGKLPKSKLKAKLKKQLKTQLDAKLKKQLKKKMQKQFQKSLGKQFAAEYKKQYQALFDQLYTKQFDTLFSQLYKKRKAAR